MKRAVALWMVVALAGCATTARPPVKPAQSQAEILPVTLLMCQSRSIPPDRAAECLRPGMAERLSKTEKNKLEAMAASVERDLWGKTTMPPAKNACRDPSVTNVDIAAECLRPGSATGARLSPGDKARLELVVTGARRQHERNRYAIEYCQYQASEAGRMERGILMPIATEVHVRNRCLEFYQRTGRLPNEGLPE